MGTFAVTIDVAGPSHDRFVTVQALVDTGSTYTVLPAASIDQPGVVREHSSRFELADGTEVEHDIGYVWVRYEGGSGRHRLCSASIRCSAPSLWSSSCSRRTPFTRGSFPCRV